MTICSYSIRKIGYVGKEKTRGIAKLKQRGLQTILLGFVLIFRSRIDKERVSFIVLLDI